MSDIQTDYAPHDVRCPYCNHRLDTFTRIEYGHHEQPWQLTCGGCRSVFMVPEPEWRGKACHPWPPVLRTVSVSVESLHTREKALLRDFIRIACGEDDVQATSWTGHAAGAEVRKLADELRNRIVGTTLSAAVAGAMNGDHNRLALAMRVVALIRTSPEVPDPPPCFQSRMSVAEMTRQILVLAKSIVAVESQSKKDFFQ